MTNSLCCGFLPSTFKNRIIYTNQHGCYLYPTAETLIIQPNKRRKSAPSAKALPEKTLIIVQLPAAPNCYIIIPSSAALIEFYSERYSSASSTTGADVRPCCRISTAGLLRLSSILKKKKRVREEFPPLDMRVAVQHSLEKSSEGEMMHFMFFTSNSAEKESAAAPRRIRKSAENDLQTCRTSKKEL